MGKKGKVWQEDVESNEVWAQLWDELADLENPKKALVVCELYSDFFGYASVLGPQIAEMMKAMGDPEVRWRRIDVLKLEEEARERAMEKSKNKEEKEKIAQMQMTVKGLEKFPSFSSPQPFFLFMKVDESAEPVIFDILKQANPPVMEEMCKKYLDEDVVPAGDLDFSTELLTNEEIAAEKLRKEEEAKLVKEINSRIDSTDPADANKLTVEEVVKMFQQFLDEDGNFLCTEDPQGTQETTNPQAEDGGEAGEAAAEEEEEAAPKPTIQEIAEEFNEAKSEDVMKYIKETVTLERLAKVKEVIAEREAAAKRKAEEEAEAARKAAEEEAKRKEEEAAAAAEAEAAAAKEAEEKAAAAKEAEEKASKKKGKKKK